MHDLLKKLSGGDRRSIGRAGEVAAEVLADPSLFKTLFNGMYEDDSVLRMRAADATEKVTAERPDLLVSFKNELIRLAGGSEQQEIRWHMAQMLVRLQLTSTERMKIFEILKSYLHDKSSIVKTFAMQGLAELAKEDKKLWPEVLQILESFSYSGTAAMKSRSKKLLRELRA